MWKNGVCKTTFPSPFLQAMCVDKREKLCLTIKVVWCRLQVIVFLDKVVFEQHWKKFHPVSSSQAISEAILSVLQQSKDMEAGQAANHSHTIQ